MNQSDSVETAFFSGKPVRLWKVVYHVAYFGKYMKFHWKECLVWASMVLACYYDKYYFKTLASFKNAEKIT